MTDEQKFEFEREKSCFEQNCVQFQSLNRIMWQVPIIAMTLTGGLWFAVSKVNVGVIQCGLLILAVLGNSGLILILRRVRFVMQKYLEKMADFHPAGFVSADGEGWLTGSRVVAHTFMWLLLISAVLSLIGLLMVPINIPVAP